MRPQFSANVERGAALVKLQQYAQQAEDPGAAMAMLESVPGEPARRPQVRRFISRRYQRSPDRAASRERRRAAAPTGSCRNR